MIVMRPHVASKRKKKKKKLHYTNTSSKERKSSDSSLLAAKSRPQFDSTISEAGQSDDNVLPEERLEVPPPAAGGEDGEDCAAEAEEGTAGRAVSVFTSGR